MITLVTHDDDSHVSKVFIDICDSHVCVTVCVCVCVCVHHDTSLNNEY